MCNTASAVGEVLSLASTSGFAKTHLMSGLHPERICVARYERRTSLPANAVCWHADQWASAATSMLAPGSSPWRPQSEPTASRDVVTDGGGGADMRRASTALLRRGY